MLNYETYKDVFQPLIWKTMCPKHVMSIPKRPNLESRGFLNDHMFDADLFSVPFIANTF